MSEWVTIFVWANHLGMQSATQANSASYPMQDGNEYRPNRGDALWLRSKGRMVHSICG